MNRNVELQFYVSPILCINGLFNWFYVSFFYNTFDFQYKATKLVYEFAYDYVRCYSEW